MYKFEVCSSCAVCVQAKTEGTVKLLILPLAVAHFLIRTSKSYLPGG